MLPTRQRMTEQPGGKVAREAFFGGNGKKLSSSRSSNTSSMVTRLLLLLLLLRVTVAVGSSPSFMIVILNSGFVVLLSWVLVGWYRSFSLSAIYCRLRFWDGDLRILL